MLTLTDYQLAAVKWAVNRRHGIIVMRPGRGKTFVAMGLAKVLLASGRIPGALILTHARGLEAYRKLRGTGVPVVILENPADIEEAGGDPTGMTGKVYVLSTSLLLKVAPARKSRLQRKKARNSPEGEKRTASPSTVNATITHSSTDVACLYSLICRILLSSGLVIVDEIHNYRNYDALVSMALSSFLVRYSGRSFGMTATPFYSRLEESFTLYGYLDRNILGPVESFQDRFLVIREAQTTGFTWIDTPMGRKRIEKPVTYPVVEDYKNLDLFEETIRPYLFLDEGSEFEIDYEPVVYGISANEEYDRLLAGIDMAKTTVLKLIGPQGVFRKSFRDGETVMAGPDAATAILVEPRDIRPGWEVAIPDSAGNYRMLQVKSVDEGSTEADIIARMPPLMRFLSSSAEKVGALMKVLDTVPATSGALIYCRFLDTIDELEEAIQARYHRPVEVIKGGERDMAGRLSSLPPTAFVIISKVALQSLDFYYDTMVIYEPVTNPGELEQLMGRVTRMNSAFRSIRLFVLLARNTIEHYFYERLIYLCEKNVYSSKQVLTHVPHPGLDFKTAGTSLKSLKKVLLWRTT